MNCEYIGEMTIKPSLRLLGNVLWLQWFAGFDVFLILFVIGLSAGWSSPYMAQLTAEDSQLHISMAEASSVTSLYILGRLFGVIIGALGNEYIGSKNSIVINGFPMLLSWVILVIADSVIWLIVARIMIGICLGVVYNCFPLFLSEITSPEIRGAVVSLGMVGSFFGLVAGSIMGAHLSISEFSYVAIVLNILYLVLFPLIPESPHQLVRIGKIEEAMKAIAKYDSKTDPSTEVESLKNFVNATSSITFVDRLREFGVPRNRRATMIIFFLNLFTQLSGMNAVAFYMEIILRNARLDIIEPSRMVIIANVFGIPGACGVSLLVDRFGRRILMIVSCFGVFASMTVLGTHFALLDAGYAPETLQWLPIVSMIGFIFFVCIGLHIVPSIVLGELFAPSIKSLASCLGNIAAAFFAFVVTKAYQPLVNDIGEAYVLWIHAATLPLAIIFVLTLMPETKGKTLQQIQEDLAK